ncbi:MAG: Gfo/Idh/MocA family oxidoreductase [Bacteroidetes bacterium]|nr:Gfo/Idh/MocA family oxidoreductase [Bacteroidota bacterium]
MSEKIRWGILSTGHISGKFTSALKTLPEAEITAVASRDKGTAKKFAEKHGILKAYGSYSSLADDPEVDVVYIGTPHTFHLENSVLCMRAGKSVLCEKALTINAREAEEMINVAREENVFLMEAMTTRHVPLIKKIQNWIKSGKIGEVRMVNASRCLKREFKSSDRQLNLKLGGGSLLDLGIYVISFASMIFEKPPESVFGYGHIGEFGSDEQGAALLKYDKGEIANLSFALSTETVNEAFIFGTEGYIKIDEIFAVPTKAALFINKQEVEVIEEPILESGLTYEALEVMRCLKKGLKESPCMPLKESLQIMQIMDRIRAPWGLTYSNDIQ